MQNLQTSTKVVHRRVEYFYYYENEINIDRMYSMIGSLPGVYKLLYTL